MAINLKLRVFFSVFSFDKSLKNDFMHFLNDLKLIYFPQEYNTFAME